MQKPDSIARNPDLPRSMDFQALRREGIEYLQQLSGSIWTDYNEHDPGVTLLEQICYALTDVAYRTNISIEKLLFYDDDYKPVSDSNALYPPNEIFPCSALTLADYRILIMDQVSEVNNVWIDPVDEDKLGISGLYNVTAQVFNETPESEYDQVKARVKALFAANRNLGEDLNEVSILLPQHIKISANIDIRSDAVGEEVLSQLLFLLDAYLNPVVHFHVYEELLRKGMAEENIFDTPSFEHGFIQKEELPHKNDEFYVSKISEIISTVPGVRSLQNLIVYQDDVKVYGNVLKVKAGHFPQLHVDLLSNIDMTKGGIAYDFDASITKHLFEVKLDQHKSAFKQKLKWQFDKVVSKFKLKEIASFPSVQNTLPAMYGVGRYGLPEDAREERKAKARQLKGFLLLFDQVMANHLAQLQHIKELFSINDISSQTYYAKLPIEFPDLSEVLTDPTDEALQSLLAEFDHFLNRKNRILDHLLARFGERFSNGMNGKVKSLFGDLPQEKVAEEIVVLKADYLKDYVHLSRNRSKAFNYLKDSIDQDNVPVFRKKVSYELNIKDHRQHSLIKHFSDIKIDVYDPGSRTVEEQELTTDNGQTINYRHSQSEKVTFLVKDRKTFEYLFSKGVNKANYHLVQASGKYMVLFYTHKNEMPIKVFEANDVDKAKKTINKLIKYFTEINNKSEGFHVVEHVLLRPYGTDEFQFQLLDANDAVIFNSLESFEYGRQRSFAADALIAGTIKSNYKRAQLRSGGHTIILKDGDRGDIARYAFKLQSEESVATKIDSLIAYFKALEKDSNSFQKKVVLTGVKSEKRTVNRLFYNGRMSIILPAWVARFQNEEFRLLLMNALRQNVPAHLKVDMHWFDIAQMKTFEQIQKEWLEERARPEFDWKKLNGLSDRLIKILIQPEDDQP
ncbi:hypothetical protein LVD15_02800 [Fulvivirga maritima]|uniref:hypothetical protein n=1 Tax=Fulvivirga maritima TaxID=2904247 RepID=UPI001F2C3ECC|nr:hypothetical protein [Fulvivirga maritima]UII27376.1 hypothetical protein LVD15_02800 [Fulvivirga maritima]